MWIMGNDSTICVGNPPRGSPSAYFVEVSLNEVVDAVKDIQLIFLSPFNDFDRYSSPYGSRSVSQHVRTPPQEQDSTLCFRKTQHVGDSAKLQRAPVLESIRKPCVAGPQSEPDVPRISHYVVKGLIAPNESVDTFDW